MNTQPPKAPAAPVPEQAQAAAVPIATAANGNAPQANLRDWPLWEVFVRSKQGLEHKHCGSLHASDTRHALQMAREVYTRRQEGVSVWVVPSAAITTSDPDVKGELFDPAASKIYRHPTFYDIPAEVGHM